MCEVTKMDKASNNEEDARIKTTVVWSREEKKRIIHGDKGT